MVRILELPKPFTAGDSEENGAPVGENGCFILERSAVTYVAGELHYATV